MGAVWKRILVFWTLYPVMISSISIDSLYLDLIHRNISDFTSFDKFYRDLLRDGRQHRSIDTVSTAIKVERIRSDNYDTDYLKNSCYETASDLLYAHGYNKTDLNLSTNDIQSLLSAILYTIENPGCKRQLPIVKQQPFFQVWTLGLILIAIMKLIHLIIIFVGRDYSSALTSGGISKTLSNHAEKTQNKTDEVQFPSVKYHLWLGLGFNAFTCGIILGTISYHLIPHIYEVPNEDFNYTYLFRGTIVLCGVFLFFVVEKLLRFRFKVDETHFNKSKNVKDQVTESLDAPMIQMAKMHGTFHVHERDHVHHNHSDGSVRLPSTVDSVDEETVLQVDQPDIQNEQHVSHHHKNEHQTRNLILYHLIYDFSNDLIYGCGLSTALTNDRLIGLVLWMLIFSEGFRRHSQLFSSFGRKHGFAIFCFSIVFLIIGYIIGGIITGVNQQFNINLIYVPKEYIYSIVYGALFYTALVTLIPELNDFGQHLQVVIKTVNQTSKQRHLLKISILLCQNLFLIFGVLIALALAIIWRYQHRMHISEYLCKRDPSRIFCHFSS